MVKRHLSRRAVAREAGFKWVEYGTSPHRVKLYRTATGALAFDAEGELAALALDTILRARDLQETPGPAIDRASGTLTFPDQRPPSPPRKPGRGRPPGTDDSLGTRGYAIPKTPGAALSLLVALITDERLARGDVVAAGRLLMSELKIDPDEWLT